MPGRVGGPPTKKGIVHLSPLSSPLPSNGRHHQQQRGAHANNTGPDRERAGCRSAAGATVPPSEIVFLRYDPEDQSGGNYWRWTGENWQPAVPGTTVPRNGRE
jgi:hypothetical protein